LAINFAERISEEKKSAEEFQRKKIDGRISANKFRGKKFCGKFLRKKILLSFRAKISACIPLFFYE
jgi:hypothetical protein